MAQLYSNNASSQLAAGITDVATSLSVVAGHGVRFPAIALASDYFLVTLYQIVGANEANHEIVKVTARNTDTLTIVRAQEGTTARAFNANDPIQLRMTAGSVTSERGLGAFGAFHFSDKVIRGNVVLPEGVNAMSAGPIVIEDGSSVTPADDGVWTIV